MPGLIQTRSAAGLVPDLVKTLHERRDIDPSSFSLNEAITDTSNVADILRILSAALSRNSAQQEADAVEIAREKVIDSPNFGGLGIGQATSLSDEEHDEVVFLVDAWLEAVNAGEKIIPQLPTTTNRSPNARPMTLAQKIFTQHVVGGCAPQGLRSGDVVRVNIDWILASELSWSSMERTHRELGEPGCWRNDRLWIAGDHVVHPQVASQPKIKEMVEIANKAKKAFRMTEFQGMNYTIMHTEFVRERAEPGMLCLGSDSHTCSAGAVGCLAIGLGAADVQMALSVGETWFKIPESIKIELIGVPAFGVSGKDVILYILRELKRNTVAAERIVEFVGPGLQHLSCDARFAVSNMCTEFGAVTGIFQPDEIVDEYISHRRREANKTNSTYFKADDDAEFASKHVIDLSKIEPFVAVYPEPDHVVPVSEMNNLHLDGVFIGACTTTEEELVLAALVLRAGLEKGLPLSKGKRHYVPGSLPIVEKLRELGLLEVYEAAGFTRGPPGCSYCVGLSAEKASEGETWLSSQNRNFKNRMGAGAFGHVTTAMVCAASSFNMQVTDPRSLIPDMDVEFFKKYRGIGTRTLDPIVFVEPGVQAATGKAQPKEDVKKGPAKALSGLEAIQSKIVVLGDFIDTDALSPGETLTTCKTAEDFGKHVLKYTHPDFREKVHNGQQVVVAGHAMGVGSSRESAVSALKGVGVKAVIARSFAFIFGRNLPSLGLLGIVVTDEAFYSKAQEGTEIRIDPNQRIIQVAGEEFSFELSDIEAHLTADKGVTASFLKHGKRLWGKMTDTESGSAQTETHVSKIDNKLDW